MQHTRKTERNSDTVCNYNAKQLNEQAEKIRKHCVHEKTDQINHPLHDTNNGIKISTHQNLHNSKQKNKIYSHNTKFAFTFGVSGLQIIFQYKTLLVSLIIPVSVLLENVFIHWLFYSLCLGSAYKTKTGDWQSALIHCVSALILDFATNDFGASIQVYWLKPFHRWVKHPHQPRGS